MNPTTRRALVALAALALAACVAASAPTAVSTAAGAETTYLVLAPQGQSTAKAAARVAADLDVLGLETERRTPGTVAHLVTGDLPSYRHTAKLLGGPEGSVTRVLLGETPVAGLEPRV